MPQHLQRKLGVENAEVDTLKEAVAAALAVGPLSPAQLKATLGNRVRSLGAEGKGRGLTTTLPLALGLLQAEGRIRRKPTNGRLDTQRYDYESWDPPPGPPPAPDEAAADIARLFFAWAGAATLKDFRDFTAFTARVAQPACDRAGIVIFGGDTGLLALPEAAAEFESYRAPAGPVYNLVGNMDPFIALRRSSKFWLREEDGTRLVPNEKGVQPASELAELWSHAILDRGRLIGLWEFDPDEGSIAWGTWEPADDALRSMIEAMETYIREELKDARSFSLDSPASRRPRLNALRAMSSQ